MWFACALVPALACIFAGIDFLPSYEDYVPDAGAGVPAYALGVFRASCGMARDVFSAGSWRSPWFALALYLVFCVTSEATLSGSDLKSAWKGFAGMVLVLFCANLVPVVGEWLSWAVAFLGPWLFPVHAIMAFVLIADAIFLVAIFAIHRCARLVVRRN